MPRPGVDINGGKGPHLAGPPASGGSLGHMPRPGVDKNNEKVPYLARILAQKRLCPVSLSVLLHICGNIFIFVGFS